METTLNITKLIESAERLVYDGRINMAAYGEVPVHEIQLEDGTKYQLSVTMTLIKSTEQEKIISSSPLLSNSVCPSCKSSDVEHIPEHFECHNCNEDFD